MAARYLSTRFLLLASALPLAAQGKSAPAQTLPKVPDGWTLEIVAAAPKVQHPTVVCAAPDGRVFVGEDPMDMKPPADRAGGRVVCLHPDGHFTVFAEGLHAPFGLLYLDGRLYVHHSPRLSVFRDDGGVGRDRADILPCTNPKPWALDWNDHVPANLRLAMDGFLYMSVGDKGMYGAVGRDGSRAELRGGGVVRLRPDATELEVFSRGTRNSLDVAINAEDEVFTFDNTDEHHWMGRLTHMVDGGFYGYPWDFHPRRLYTLWMLADFGPGAATAALAYNEDALPPEYHGSLFLADFGKRTVLRVRVERDGASYRAVSREDFFRDPPADFWPVGLALSPDGLGLYVTDWQLYDRKDVVIGRLWKATYAGPSRGAPKPPWYLRAAMGERCDASTPELVRALGHPAQSVRLVAQRRLAERGGEAAGAAAELLRDPTARPEARWHALWTLDAIDGAQAPRADVVSAARGPDRSLRLQALRQLGTRRVKSGRSLLVESLRDPDAAVRFHAATALGRLGNSASVPPLLTALDEKDHFARFAVFTALGRIGRAHPAAWDLVARGLESPIAAVGEGTVFAMREAFDSRVVTALAGAVGGGAKLSSTRAAAVEALAGLSRQDPPWNGEWWTAIPGVSPYHPALSPRPPRRVDWEGTAGALDALRAAVEDAGADVRRAAVRGLAELRDAGSLAALRSRFASEDDGAVRREILRALGSLKDPSVLDLLASVLRRESAPETLSEAVAAVEAVGGEGSRALLASFLDAPRGGNDVVVLALDALARLGGAQVLDALRAKAEDSDLAVRRAAVRALGRVRDPRALSALLGAFERDETKFEAAASLAPLADMQALDAYLWALASSSPELRQASAKALEVLGAAALSTIEKRVEAGIVSAAALGELQRVFAWAKESPIHRTQAAKLDPARFLEFALQNLGDAARGRKLFEDERGMACARCHKAAGRGGEIGPDLSAIGTQYPRRDLAESVLYPSRKVREGYQQVIVVTQTGQVISGVVRGETPEEVVLLDAGGQRHPILKRDVAERRTSEVSLMPEALHAGLSLQDFADLLAYIESLKGIEAPRATTSKEPAER
jgi:putative heme-binding domain-containing protein